MKIPNLSKRLSSFRKFIKITGLVFLLYSKNNAEIKFSIQEAHKPNAIVIVANPEVDDGGAFLSFNEEIRKIEKAGYKVFVDTVSNEKEYFRAFEKGLDSMIYGFDFYLGVAHGNSGSIILGRSDLDSSTNELTSEDLKGRDLSSYFNYGARGIQMSCSVADTSVEKCFAQSLSNSMGIPIEAPTRDVYVIPLSDNLRFSIYERFFEFIKKSGFNSQGEGNFNTRGVTYRVHKNNNNQIFIEPPVHSYWQLAIENLYLPSDFDVSRIFHFESKYITIAREVKPQK